MFFLTNLLVRLLKARTSSSYFSLNVLMKVSSLIEILSWLSSTRFSDYFKKRPFISASIEARCAYFSINSHNKTPKPVLHLSKMLRRLRIYWLNSGHFVLITVSEIVLIDSVSIFYKEPSSLFDFSSEMLILITFMIICSNPWVKLINFYLFYEKFLGMNFSKMFREFFKESLYYSRLLSIKVVSFK